jgi:hypothetical protein
MITWFLKLIIENLVEDPKLKAIHTVINLRHNGDSAYVTFAYNELEAAKLLADRAISRTSKVSAQISHK